MLFVDNQLCHSVDRIVPKHRVVVDRCSSNGHQRHDNNGLVVLYSYYRLGSSEESGDAAYFYYLDDGSWKIDEELSDRLVGVKNAKQAKTKLK